jgi:diadenosine tetraphosphate (Ap4A) HIT family hydrolase
MRRSLADHLVTDRCETMLLRMGARERRDALSNPVKAWTDPDLWAKRLSPDGCPFCPMEPWGAHVELPASWVLIPDEAVLRGYVVVVSKKHVIEPFELEADERAQFWEDSMRAAAAVASVVRPVKVNYEIHGNTIPHLHLHIFPRFRGDPFERSPIDPHRVAPVPQSAADIESLRAAISGDRT